uniref:17beta-estradiol 17-dehydrogenase n=1 Tax=Nomascus leucogenys TaxID=61853 RepID=A0A2I3GSP4_NOMLE
MESALPTASFLYWVGTGTVANLTLHICYSGVGNELEVGPGLGEWAVVTGSTDAIGKSYAEELAKRGMMVVLISRLQDKLDQVSREIKEKFKVEARTIAVDFASEDIYDKIKTGLAGLEIGVLVNNVGMSYEDPKYFLDIPDLDNMIKKMININILSVCKMTQLVSKGANLNLSAGRGMFPVPLLTICSATKTFVDFFSQCLHGEYRSKSIFVQSVLPYFVATKLAKIRKPTLDDHALKGLIISILPSWIYFKITMSTRDHYLRKNKKN